MLGQAIVHLPDHPIFGFIEHKQHACVLAPSTPGKALQFTPGLEVHTWPWEPPQNMPNRSGSPFSFSLVRFSCRDRKFQAVRWPPCLHETQEGFFLFFPFNNQPSCLVMWTGLVDA